MPTYIIFKDPEQLQRGGLKQAGPVCFKRGFIERGHTTSPSMLSTIEKGPCKNCTDRSIWTLIVILFLSSQSVLMTTNISSVGLWLHQSNSNSKRPAPTLWSIFSFIDGRSKNRPFLDVSNSMNIQPETENKISAKRSWQELSNTLLITKFQWMVAKIYASYSR